MAERRQFDFAASCYTWLSHVERTMSKTCVMCDTRLAKGRRQFCGLICQIKGNCSCTAPNECWPWRSAVRPENGYAVIRVKIAGRYVNRSPSRIMYACAVGDVSAGVDVVNTCGTKNCCNPKHLKLRQVSQSLSVHALAVA